MTVQVSNTSENDSYALGGFNYGVISAGPAAELATIMNLLIDLYQKLMSQWAKMANTESEVQAQTGLASAQAQAYGGQEQASATRSQAWQEGISACVSVAQVGVQFAATNSLSKQMSEEQTELENLNKLNDTVQTKMTTGAQDIEMTELGEGNPVRDPNVLARINEMKSGRLTSSHTQGTTDNEAISAAKTKELKEIKKQLDTQISSKYESISAKSGQMQQRITYTQMFSQTSNGVVGAACHGAAANYQAEQGQEQGISTNASTASQMAGNAQSQASGYLGKYYEMIMNTVSQFRAGAQAYPQG